MSHETALYQDALYECLRRAQIHNAIALDMLTASGLREAENQVRRARMHINNAIEQLDEVRK